jgi:hypothetical protein
MLRTSSLAPYIVSSMLIIAGLIHLPPLVGALGHERLAALYRIPIEGPDLVILMRHRAVLFGLLGAFMIVAAFRPSLQVAAFVGSFVSVISFLWLANSVGDYNAAIGRVVIADIVALICLLIGAIALTYMQIQRK